MRERRCRESKTSECPRYLGLSLLRQRSPRPSNSRAEAFQRLGHRVADVQRLRAGPSLLAAPGSQADRRCWDLSMRFLVLWHNARNRSRPEYRLDCCGSNAVAEIDPNSASFLLKV